MPQLQVLGMDPSLRNWGIAKGTYDTERKQLSIAKVDVIQPSFKWAKGVRQSHKDLVSANALIDGILPHLEDASMVFVEIPIGSQSASAMKGYGVCIGILGSLRGIGKPFFELSPSEVKIAATGSKTATKQEMIDWAVEHFPNANWPSKTIKGKQSIITGKAEHMADAAAAIQAGVDAPWFQRVITQQKEPLHENSSVA